MVAGLSMMQVHPLVQSFPLSFVVGNGIGLRLDLMT
jgi:hypothetical protein